MRVRSVQVRVLCGAPSGLYGNRRGIATITISGDIQTKIWGRSSVGRAGALQASGRGFNSLRFHQVRKFAAKQRPISQLLIRADRRDVMVRLAQSIFNFERLLSGCSSAW